MLWIICAGEYQITTIRSKKTIKIISRDHWVAKCSLSLTLSAYYFNHPLYILASIDKVHIDKVRMLRIRVYWGAWLEPVDLDVTSTCHMLD